MNTRQKDLVTSSTLTLVQFFPFVMTKKDKKFLLCNLVLCKTSGDSCISGADSFNFFGRKRFANVMSDIKATVGLGGGMWWYFGGRLME